MSGGHGPVERFVLDQGSRRRERDVTVRTLAAPLNQARTGRTGIYTRPGFESVRRAGRRLERQGEVETGWMSAREHYTGADQDRSVLVVRPVENVAARAIASGVPPEVVLGWFEQSITEQENR